MPKPDLTAEDSLLEHQIIETLTAGLKEWRPDLNYPQSYSDMQACVRGMLKMFVVTRRPLVVPLRIKCHRCEGLGYLITSSNDNGNVREVKTCTLCKGRGWIEGE